MALAIAYAIAHVNKFVYINNINVWYLYQQCMQIKLCINKCIFYIALR